MGNNLEIGKKVNVWFWKRTGIGECDYFNETGTITHMYDDLFVLDNSINVMKSFIEDIELC